MSGVRIYFCTISDLFSNTLTAPCPQPALPVLRNVPWGGSDISRSLLQQKKRKVLLRKEERNTVKSHVPVGARVSRCLCWNGINSPFKREKLTELQQLSYFCGNYSSNLQASAHPEGTATPVSRDVTEMPRNRLQLENHCWEIRKQLKEITLQVLHNEHIQ